MVPSFPPVICGTFDFQAGGSDFGITLADSCIVPLDGYSTMSTFDMGNWGLACKNCAQVKMAVIEGSLHETRESPKEEKRKTTTIFPPASVARVTLRVNVNVAGVTLHLNLVESLPTSGNAHGPHGVLTVNMDAAGVPFSLLGRAVADSTG